MSTIYLTSYELPAGEKKHLYEHALGRRLLRYGLMDYFGFEVTAEWLDANITAKDGEKPFISGCPEFHFNISHCEGLVVCALAKQPVGVDVEAFRPIKDSLIRRVLTENEQTLLYNMSCDEEARMEWFSRFWTLKESYLKFTGKGLAGSMTSVEFSFPENETPDTWSPICSDPSVTAAQWALPSKKMLSACGEAEEHFELRDVSAINLP